MGSAGAVDRVAGTLIGAMVGLLAAAPLSILLSDVLRDGRWLLYGGLVLGATAGALAVEVALGSRDRIKGDNVRRHRALEGAALLGSGARREAQRKGMLRRFGDSTRGRSDMEAGRQSAAAPAEAREGSEMERQREQPGATGAVGELNALLGRGSEFDGKLAFEGTVRIDGTFTGEITTSDTLIVGDGAKVQAEISCGTILVHGEVTGNVRATQAIELHKPARVHGDITSPSLMIERGVVFEGRSQMEDLEPSKIVPITASGGESAK